MASPLTNAMLTQLLLGLGFEEGAPAPRNHRVWRHPDSGCTFLLPTNKAQQRTRPADLIGIKAQLDLHGHLDEEAFEIFVAEGKLPVRSPEQR